MRRLELTCRLYSSSSSSSSSNNDNNRHVCRASYLENAQSTKNRIGPIKFFPAETARWFSTGPVLTVRRARLTVSIGLHVQGAPIKNNLL